ncbi:MAG: hypothetical protein ACI857_001591 [Arenicella sp.]|jgi:hypothetical protein
MNLTVKCKHCNEINKTPNQHNNRVKYATHYGDEFEIVCSKCSELSEYHVHDIVAIAESFAQLLKRKLIFIAVVLGVTIVASLLLLDKPSIAAAICILPIVSIIFFQWFETSQISEFNAHKLKGSNTKVSFRK